MSSSAEFAPSRIVFVCTGNTCRSPLAEVIARRELDAMGTQQIEVASYGVAASPGGPASGGSLRAADRHGLDLSQHGSRQLTPEAVSEADLILTMSPGHAERVIALGGRDKVSLLTAYASGGHGLDGLPIPDPFGGSDDRYEETYLVLEGLVREAVRRIVREAGQ